MKTLTETTKTPRFNAYGQAMAYEPESPIPEMRELLFKLMQERKEIRFDIMPDRMIHGGYSRAMPPGQSRATVGPVSVTLIDHFHYLGRPYSIAYTETGASLFDTSEKTRQTNGDVRPSLAASAMDRLIFDEPCKLCDVRKASEMRLAEFLLHSSMNSSFDYRRETIQPLFSLYEPSRARSARDSNRRAYAEFTIALSDTKLNAEQLKAKLTALITATKYRTQFDSRGIHDRGTILDELDNIGKSFPQEALDVMLNEDDRYRSLAKQAQALDLIIYNQSRNAWEYLENGEPYRDNEIVNVEGGKNQLQELIRYFKSNRAVVEGLIEKIKQASK